MTFRRASGLRQSFASTITGRPSRCDEHYIHGPGARRHLAAHRHEIAERRVDALDGQELWVVVEKVPKPVLAVRSPRLRPGQRDTLE